MELFISQDAQRFRFLLRNYSLINLLVKKSYEYTPRNANLLPYCMFIRRRALVSLSMYRIDEETSFSLGGR